MNFKWRLLILAIGFGLFSLLIIARLFYWQILASDKLTNLALSQQSTILKLDAHRGEILTSDDTYLAANQSAYFAYLIRSPNQEFNSDMPEELAKILYWDITRPATPSALLKPKDIQNLTQKAEQIITDRISQPNLIWIPLARRLTETKKQALEDLNLNSLYFEDQQTRFYPEASMAAQLIGFVGYDDQGNDLGYHGLEGYYQKELAGRPGIKRQEKDAFNQPILMGSFIEQNKKDGRQLKLYLNRTLQYLIEKKLEEGIEHYGASAGSVTIMDPNTGGILAMASYPKYDPSEYYLYQKSHYLNPVVSDAFEPGSIFKIFVMAAALDTDSVKMDTKCDICDQPVKIDKYTIKTWDDKYHKDAGMTDIIVNSDNVGMVFVSQKLGLDKFLDYFHQFGFSKETGIDLQDEVFPEPKPDSQWTYVDLATASFGQGFLSTGIQLLQGVCAIANGGQLIKPQVVQQVIDAQQPITIPAQIKQRVIQKETAQKVTEMMVAAAQKGEAKWTRVQGYSVAGKTGTAQIAVGGKYTKEKTNASFIGFAPAKDPQFAMLVTLKEPSTSQWASETAAPLWFNIAKDLFNYYNILPETTP